MDSEPAGLDLSSETPKLKISPAEMLLWAFKLNCSDLLLPSCRSSAQLQPNLKLKHASFEWGSSGLDEHYGQFLLVRFHVCKIPQGEGLASENLREFLCCSGIGVSLVELALKLQFQLWRWMRITCSEFKPLKRWVRVDGQDSQDWELGDERAVAEITRRAAGSQGHRQHLHKWMVEQSEREVGHTEGGFFCSMMQRWPSGEGVRAVK